MVATPDTRYYKVRLSAAATARGERVYCQWLGWAGAQQCLAQVRIVQSTLPAYRTGKVGMVLRTRLIPLPDRRAA